MFGAFRVPSQHVANYAVEVNQVINLLPKLTVLNMRPNLVMAETPYINHCNFDWIPSVDLENYRKTMHRASRNYDWNNNQGGISGEYTIRGVLTYAKLLCTVPDELLVYLWIKIVVTHIMTTYSKGREYTPEFEAFAKVGYYAFRKLREDYTIDSRIKYTMPISVYDMPIIKEYTERMLKNGFDSNDFLHMISSVVGCLVSNTVLIYNNAGS